MRIGLISSPYIPTPPIKYGGTERVVHYLARGLTELGHQVTVFGSGDSTTPYGLIPYVTQSWINISDNSADYEEFEQTAKARLVEVVRQHRKVIDVIHDHVYFLSELAGLAPYLCTLHMPVDGVRDGRQKLLPFSFVSKYQYVQAKGFNRVGMVYHGLDPSEFPLAETAGRYVCFIGRFDTEKQPNVAIQAAEKAGIQITLGGRIDPQQSEYFFREVKSQLDFEAKCFVGEVGFEEKTKILRGAVANMHLINGDESFGLTVLEAMYCGVPTIAYPRGSMKELIKPGINGYLVNNVAEAVEAIGRCRQLDRRRVRAEAEQYHYLTMAKQYVELYHKIGAV